MALAYDATSNANGAFAGPFSFSHTCTGSNRLLVIGITIYDASDTVNSMTYNGVGCTLLSGTTSANGQHLSEIWYLIAPATGSNTLAVGVTASVTDIGIGVVSFNGAHQTIPFGTPAVNTGTSTTPTVTVSSATDEIVFDVLNIAHSGTLTVGAGQTERWNGIAGSGFSKYAGSTETGAASTVMSWSNTNSAPWTISAVGVKPAGGASYTPHLLTMLGVGA